ncbi:SET domain-containing protein-lysine N-methyltransferase [Massilia dura]|uniref:SET domain-containing protein-lysine N-methyltransferase n=1 Tax=Pseudoduganella dura TaxID=321982 RepID=A0A6I3XE77_9BURK|nr:SET domain-containing protein-lysine N-methyltransferase [Pseudoduganella dura]MUI12543.1 SET domain-containing protein-lysine N-methyltransferase [Pseudoduganella dura]GGY03839.1 SET domain-containing protein-lysine N-methyltransferase [Pseudoduganella dura]
MTKPTSQPKTPALFDVHDSPIHGKGVFARRKIPAGTRIIEYTGEIVDWDETCRRTAEKGGPINHTFFFTLASGLLIDGGAGGNDSRFINHSCDPNCEAMEEDDRVFIHTLRDIEKGEELRYNYGLIYDERHTPAVKKAFACRCGAPNCTGLMLAPKKRSRGKKAAG